MAVAITVMMQAASFGRPPRRSDNKAYSGYNATANTALQARMAMDG